MQQRMRLYDILSDRTAVNMLKILYDQEHVAKTAHTMPFFRLNSLLGNRLQLHTVLRLESAGLLTAEKVDNMFIISLNTKGKEFIEQMDRLKEVLDNDCKTRTQPAYKIEYGLTEIEQKILVLCFKMQGEQGCPVSLDSLASELYPKNISSKKSAVSKILNKLVKLNLVKKTKRGKESFFDTTESGRKAMKNQLMESVV